MAKDKSLSQKDLGDAIGSLSAQIRGEIKILEGRLQRNLVAQNKVVIDTLGEELDKKLQVQETLLGNKIESEIDSAFKHQVEMLRSEIDTKFAEQEINFEDTLNEQTQEILDGTARVVKPINSQLKDQGKRIRILERKAA